MMYILIELKSNVKKNVIKIEYKQIEKQEFM